MNDNQLKPSTRMKCQQCHKRHSVAFHVPTEMWQEVMEQMYWWGPICIQCFTEQADEKLIKWADVIKFYPADRISSLEHCGFIINTQVKA